MFKVVYLRRNKVEALSPTSAENHLISIDTKSRIEITDILPAGTYFPILKLEIFFLHPFIFLCHCAAAMVEKRKPVTIPLKK